MTDTKQTLVEPRLLKGFRDYLPEAMQIRQVVVDAVRETAARAGFHQIMTPALEYAEVLLGAGGAETDKQVFRWKDQGDRDVAMRFDLTVPLARFVAEHQGELVFPFKRLHIGEVWRGEKPQKGRYREFTQCDLDIIGPESAASDIEIILCIFRALEKIFKTFDAGTFTMSIGHRALLSSLIRRFLTGVSPEGEIEALVTLDKLDKIGAAKVAELLRGIAPAGDGDGLIRLLSARDHAGDTPLDQVEQALAGEESGLQALQRYRETIASLRAVLGTSAHGRLSADLSLARGLGYYTGIVFESRVDRCPTVGSVNGGGRYDNLASRFTRQKLPGVGGSIGLDRLVCAFEELGLIKPYLEKLSGRRVFVAVATTDAQSYAFNLVEMLRGAGVTTDIGLNIGKLGAQFKTADRAGFPYVVIVGTDEVRAKTYSLKHMRTGEEEKNLPVKELVAKVQGLLGRNH